MTWCDLTVKPNLQRDGRLSIRCRTFNLGERFEDHE